MQDVIFNGAGERKPVGRASVELFFDNSAGRIGGQWGQYAGLSIKRVLTRDGDSTYYINNIPVRRRDIHDLFLGTGLGPRAYAISEQGMISRVIEAKPEELRVFLEEAAGVSKYKERRKETEARLADARVNLARVEDIRIELGQQLEKLDAQAKVATEYRDFEARLKQVQHLLWFSKQQDAANARERHTTAIASLTVALDAVQAEIRAAESRQETLRADHYAAGDAMHEKQGAFYEANAEVTRLERQLAFAGRRTRIWRSRNSHRADRCPGRAGPGAPRRPCRGQRSTMRYRRAGATSSEGARQRRHCRFSACRRGRTAVLAGPAASRLPSRRSA
jgi:chromosome segregation protein